MIILGFDTTTASISVALLKDGAIISSHDTKCAVTHSTTLLPTIDTLLVTSGVSVEDIGLLSCSAGPGSFTGVRIGVATAKGLAAARNIPAVGVSSLAALAEPFKKTETYILPVIGARRGNVYAALFHSDGKTVERVTDDDLIAISDLSELCKNNGASSVCVIGDEADSAVQYLLKDGIDTFDVPQDVKAEAGYGAALLGYKKYMTDKDEPHDHFSLKPVYLRKSQAEREREERLSKK